MFSDTELQVMTKHYLIACIWAYCPEGTNPRASKRAIDRARLHVQSFATAAGEYLRNAIDNPEYGMHPDCGDIAPGAAAAGHDLYLTSQGHGVGFWDRKALKNGLGDMLTEVCEKINAPEPYFYRGWLYFVG